MKINYYLRCAFPAICLFWLQGCVVQNILRQPAVPQAPVVGAKARVRLDAGVPEVAVSPNKSCHPEPGFDSSLKYNGGARGDGSLISPKTRHIGIPITSATPKYYNEYEVEAGRPMVVAVWFFSQIGSRYTPTLTSRCGPVYTLFTPAEGRDYEIKGEWDSLPSGHKICLSRVYEIARAAGGGIELHGVHTRLSPPCLEK